MPARIEHQKHPALQALFAERIREKMERERLAVHQRVEAGLSRWIPRPLKTLVHMLVSVMWSNKHTRDDVRGASGEGQLTIALRLRLSARWCLLPNVLIQPDDKHLTQIDLLAVGPPGVFVIEAKNWRGAIKAAGDRWQRKHGSGWIDCESPTRQNAAHVRHLLRWWDVSAAGDTSLPSPTVFPLVVLLDTRWLRVHHPPMPIFDRPSAVARYLLRAPAIWTPAEVSCVVSALVSRPSYQDRPLVP